MADFQLIFKKEKKTAACALQYVMSLYGSSSNRALSDLLSTNEAIF